MATNITDLTDAQKQVMTKLAKAPTPTVALTEISDGRKLVAARDMLDKLDLIDFDENEAEITDQGWDLMRDLNLVDEAGELTDEGIGYASEGEDVPQSPSEPAGQPETGGEGEGGGEEEEPVPESVQFKFLYTIHNRTRYEDDDMF